MNPYALYAESQGRTLGDQLRHDIASGGSLPMKGYVNWVRANHPGNRRDDGSLIHPLIP